MTCLKKLSKSTQNCLMISEKLVSKSWRYFWGGENLFLLKEWIIYLQIFEQNYAFRKKITFLDLIIEIWSLICRFTSEQTKFLREKAKKAIPNKIHFFKILKTCKEIKWVFEYFWVPDDVWTSHLILKSEPSHPIEETHFVCLHPQSPSFGNYPEFLTTGAGW